VAGKSITLDSVESSVLSVLGARARAGGTRH
jgi:hypothetical protein